MRSIVRTKDIAADPKNPVIPKISSEHRIGGLALQEQMEDFSKSRLMAAQFGNIVAVLTQSPSYRDMPIEVLKRRIVPPLLRNQFSVAEGKTPNSGSTVPLAFITWAQVSQSIHSRLSASSDMPLKLSEDEWSSGANIWIIDAAGGKRFVSSLIRNLRSRLKNADQNIFCKVVQNDEVKTATIQSPVQPS